MSNSFGFRLSKLARRLARLRLDPAGQNGCIPSSSSIPSFNNSGAVGRFAQHVSKLGNSESLVLPVRSVSWSSNVPAVARVDLTGRGVKVAAGTAIRGTTRHGCPASAFVACAVPGPPGFSRHGFVTR